MSLGFRKGHRSVQDDEILFLQCNKLKCCKVILAYFWHLQCIKSLNWVHKDDMFRRQRVHDVSKLGYAATLSHSTATGHFGHIQGSLQRRWQSSPASSALTESLDRAGFKINKKLEDWIRRWSLLRVIVWSKLSAIELGFLKRNLLTSSTPTNRPAAEHLKQRD